MNLPKRPAKHHNPIRFWYHPDGETYLLEQHHDAQTLDTIQLADKNRHYITKTEPCETLQGTYTRIWVQPTNR